MENVDCYNNGTPSHSGHFVLKWVGKRSCYPWCSLRFDSISLEQTLGFVHVHPLEGQWCTKWNGTSRDFINYALFSKKFQVSTTNVGKNLGSCFDSNMCIYCILILWSTVLFPAFECNAFYMLCLFKGPVGHNSWKLAIAINSTCSAPVSCSVMKLYSNAPSQLKNLKSWIQFVQSGLFYFEMLRKYG